MRMKVQGYSLNLAKVTQISKLKLVFFSETVGSFEIKFYEINLKEHRSLYTNKMRLMAAMPIYGKNI